MVGHVEPACVVVKANCGGSPLANFFLQRDWIATLQGVAVWSALTSSDCSNERHQLFAQAVQNSGDFSRLRAGLKAVEQCIVRLVVETNRGRLLPLQLKRALEQWLESF